MAKCSCSGQTCGCRLIAGAGVSIEGSGTPRDPWVVTAAGGEGGATGFLPGDTKDTVRTDTPAGWLECNGQTVSRTAYPDLFAAIGTRWGQGDGFSTFNLPAFGGRSRVGAGPGYALGASGGQAETTLQVGNIPPHTHTIGNHTHDFQHSHSMNHGHGNTSDVSNFHAHTFQFGFATADNTETKASGGARRVTNITASGNDVAKATSDSGGHVHGVADFNGNTGGASTTTTSAAGAQTTSSTGQGAAFTNLPPYRVVRVLIKT